MTETPENARSESAMSTLRDIDEPERAFRADRVLAEGRRFQIVGGTYLPDDTQCVAKAPRYDEADVEQIEARREALQQERQIRDRGLPGTSETIATLQIDGDHVRNAPETVLLYESPGEESLFEYIQRQPTSGLPPKEALKVATQLVDWLSEWHDSDVVFMDLDPRHVIVERGLPVALVGVTNAAEFEQAPDEREMPHREAPYVAPEARQERSGTMRRPLSDVYSFGALFSFMLTGHEPTTAVESPLTKPAYNNLMSLRPRGIARLVAGTLHPMAKHRVNSLDELRPMMNDDDLPGEDAEGFQLVDLPAPWSGAEPPGPNRSVRSNLSPGPLISVDPDLKDAPEQRPSAAPATPDQPPAQIDPVEEFSKPEDAEITSRQELAEAREDAKADGDADDIPDDTDRDRREISMLDEQLGERDGDPPPAEEASLPETEPTERRSEWPAYAELPASYRIGLAFGIPALFVAIAVILGLLGVL